VTTGHAIDHHHGPPAHQHLQLVASRRGQNQQQHVHNFVDDYFGLAKAHGLDHDDVKAGGFTEQDELVCVLCDAAKCAPRRRRPDERIGVVRQAWHARLVAQNAAARPR
jgi:hypothetical protein